MATDPVLSPTQMLQQPTAEERLKRQRAYAALGMLMNVEPTVNVGKMLAGGAENEADREYKRQLEQAEAERRAQERAENRDWQQQVHADLQDYRDASLDLQRGREQRLSTQGGGGLTEAQRLREERAARTEAAAIEARKNAGVAALSDRARQSGLPGLMDSANAAKSVLEPYMAPGKDIPGIGPVENFKPDWAHGTEAQIVRSTVQGVANQLLKLRSGAAVTDPEMRRFLTEVAMGRGVKEEVFKRRWPEIMRILEAEQANLYSGATPDVLEEYQRRNEAQRPAAPAPQAAPTQGAPPVAVYRNGKRVK